MDRATIKEVLRDMLGPVTLVDYKDWVSLPCPFARWRHQSGKDSHPSFGVLATTNGTSIYHCFTCKSAGKFSHLPKDLASVTGDLSFLEFDDDVFQNEELGAGLASWEQRRQEADSHHPIHPDSVLLEVFDSAYDHPYLQKRNIDNALVAKLDLRVDPDDKGAERILFPVFSYDGVFYGYTGRATTDVKPKVRDYFGLQKHNVLLGAHLIERKEINYVMLVEGPFDFARMVSYDIPAMATLHSSLTKNQAAILKHISKPVIVLLDNDKAGREGALVVKKLLDRHLPLLKCRYPHNKKDPDQLTKNEVYAMIKDARLL